MAFSLRMRTKRAPHNVMPSSLSTAVLWALVHTCAVWAQTYQLPWWHPTLENIARNRIQAPNGHSQVESLIMPTILAHTDEEHDGDIDGNEGFLRRPDEYPSDHPNLDLYFVPAPAPSGMTVSTGHYHPDVDAEYARGTAVSSAHPSIQSSLSSHLPSGHPNVDTLLANPASNPLPWWHPPLSQFVQRRNPIVFTVNTSQFHPNATERFNAGAAMPGSHPSVQSLMASVLSASHPNVDTILNNPGSNPMPDWHPSIDTYIARTTGNFTALVNIGYYHPDMDAEYAAGNAVSSNHPSIQPLLTTALPSTHPDVDTCLSNPSAYPLPDWHVRLSFLVARRDPVVFSVAISKFHPDVDTAMSRQFPMAASHPSVHAMMASVLTASHVNVDAVLQDPAANPLPAYHPPLERYVSRPNNAAANAYALPAISVSYTHPNIDAAYARGETLPSGHPKVGPMMSSTLPPSHPDVDALLQDPSANPLPLWHPKLNDMVVRRSFWSPGLILTLIMCSVLVVAWLLRVFNTVRRALRGSYKTVGDTTKMVSPVLSPVTPPRPDNRPDDNNNHNRRHQHDNRGTLLSETTNPTYMGGRGGGGGGAATKDVNIDGAVAMPTVHDGRNPSSSTTSRPALPSRPAPRLTDVSSAVAAQRNLPSGQRNARTTPSPTPGGDTSSTATDVFRRPDRTIPTPVPAPRRRTGRSSFLTDLASATHREEHPGDELPHRRLHLHRMSRLNASHQADVPIYDKAEAVAPDVPVTRVAYEKVAGASHSVWSRVMKTRIPGSQWNTGDCLFSVLYLLANVVALMASPNYPVDRGLGSLAAANTMFLVIPATRNNILTWLLGLSFDHIILQHRFLGRVTILIALLHFGWYADRIGQHLSEHAYWTGLVALLCGLGIAVTTTNWMRRHQFNVFFWTHYLFFGFFAFAFIHVPQAQPFLAVAMGTYALDKALRAVWTLAPRKTMEFCNHGDKTARVRFRKNPLNRIMGRHKVGQYMFLNFPALSLTEWHPFSVSSGPDEDFVELHIRALGDHTRDIVAHAKQCASQGKQTWVRSDGPYGYLNFSYRRYGVLLLAGGGIGVTPVMSLLADIYGEGRSHLPHCMQRVCVVWVMPYATEAELFLTRLLHYVDVSRSNRALPELDLRVHCTRAKAEDASVVSPLIAGRPDFAALLDECAHDLPLASTLVFACGPGRMVNQLWDETTTRNRRGHRVDFHHETFEF
eukprot:m.22326 g.22326  ORF g.22326 m.22326 type:complete len:1212 (+) comp3975_c0_seq2:424-4059(+)